MVTPGYEATAALRPAAGQDAAGLEIKVDGSLPLTPESVAAIGAVCDAAEDRADGLVVVHVSGAPESPQAPPYDASVALVSKWERALRRLERLPATTVALATGDCGGLALDVLLATDYRIAASGLRLLVPVASGATWPGMALYRLARQSRGSVRTAALFGVPIEASEALAWQLVDELADDVTSALAGVTRLAGSFAGREVAIRRQLMFDAPTLSFEDALGRHLAACDRELRRMSGAVSP